MDEQHGRARAEHAVVVDLDACAVRVAQVALDAVLRVRLVAGDTADRQRLRDDLQGSVALCTLRPFMRSTKPIDESASRSSKIASNALVAPATPARIVCSTPTTSASRTAPGGIVPGFRLAASRTNARARFTASVASPSHSELQSTWAHRQHCLRGDIGAAVMATLGGEVEPGQLTHLSRDGRDRLERASPEHALGELDPECLLDGEHQVDARV